MEIFNLEMMSPEVLDGIFKNLTNPDDILNLANSSTYLNIVLKKSIVKIEKLDKINSDTGLLYLDIDWLNTYQRLNEVSDNIIFNIEINNLKNFKIPNKLKKFNIRILINNNYDIKSYNENTVVKYILQQIIYKDDIYDYTVRIIHNFENDSNLDHAIILDRSKFAIINNFSSPNNLFGTDIKLNIDYSKLFNTTLEIKLLDLTLPLDIKYYEDNENEIMFEYIQPSIIDIGSIIYPNKLFNKYMNDIIPHIEKNLVKIGEEMGIEYEFEFIKAVNGYYNTGYIHKAYILTITDLYMNNNIDLNNDNLSGETIKILQYVSSERWSQVRVKLHQTFTYPDKNINVAHFYIDKQYFDIIYM